MRVSLYIPPFQPNLKWFEFGGQTKNTAKKFALPFFVRLAKNTPFSIFPLHLCIKQVVKCSALFKKQW